jgi:two-component system, NarL family, sensor histidine kinase YdfH
MNSSAKSVKSVIIVVTHHTHGIVDHPKLRAMRKFTTNIRSTLDKHPELWFFLFANVVFLAMYIWSLFTNPALLKPATFILFTILTLIHIAVHWSLPVLGEKENWFWPYVIFQGLLAFAIVYLSENMGMIFALYMALIGEIIGASHKRSWTLYAVVFFILLSLGNYIIINGTEQSGWWVIGTLPMIIFVTMYVSLYTRASNDRDRARKLLAELETAHIQLAEYASQVEELTLTTERQRMARELHDTLAQGLAGLILQLEAADAHIGGKNLEKAQAIIQQAMSRARTTLAEARRAISDLRETPPTPTDLNETIKADIERFQASTGITCTMSLCQLPTVSPQLAENILRAINEGLMNIARHAEAAEVVLTMMCDQNRILIEIQDDGIGFDPTAVLGQSGHYGLVGIRERARLYGGSLTIESQPTQGTSLKIQLPLRNVRPLTPIT